MSVSYKAVGWTRSKRVYDAVLVIAVAMFIGVYTLAANAMHPASESPRDEATIIQALGVCGLLMLHAALWIGPLARLDRRLTPLLYNRRHLGVLTFLVGLAHAAFATVYYHGFGDTFPLVSLLTANADIWSLARFPFEWLGLGALTILFFMAATSHDFWLRGMGARAWKRLHMLVYAAYALLVMHVALGALQSETAVAPAVALCAGAGVTVALHLAAAFREARRDRPIARNAAAHPGFIDVCAVDDVPPSRARVVSIGGERVAVFRDGDSLAAVTNVCAHQGGPLGEGKIIDGCITCPWHGWQYRASDGCSPPPFTEKIATYRVRVVGSRVLVHPTPLPPGAPASPAPVTPLTVSGQAVTDDFYVGYLPRAPKPIARRSATVAGCILVVGVAAAGVTAASQHSAGDGRWDQSQTQIEGVFIASPHPMLLVPGADPAHGPRSVLLVNAGKCGAFAPDDSCGPLAVLVTDANSREAARAQAMRALDGKPVRATGTVLSRGVPGSSAERRMLELSAGARAVIPLGSAAPPALAALHEATTPTDLGEATIIGEVADSKCFLGAMKPGRGKVHRGCAVGCISGGVPAALAGLDPATGEIRIVLLATAAGEPMVADALPLVGDRVEARGRLNRVGDALVLHASPAAIRRVSRR